MGLFKYILAPVLLLAIGLSSCSSGGDDDEGGGGRASTTAGVLDRKTGLRLKKFGSYTVYYDDMGRLDYISDRYGRWEFSYNPNVISYQEGYGGYDSDGGSYTVGYNSAGYLASISVSRSETDGDDRWSESAKGSFSYDGSGHLTRFSGSGQESGTEYGERYSESWSFSTILTWNNNRLTKIVSTETETKNGKKSSNTETITWTYSYDNDYQNVYRQWTPSVANWLDDHEAMWAYVGLLGVGPNVLPSSGTIVEEAAYSDGERYSDDNYYTFRYGFNDDGSVAYTYVDRDYLAFSYDYADVEEHTTRAAADEQRGGEGRMEPDLFRMLRHPKRRH